MKQPILLLPNAKSWIGTKIVGTDKLKMRAYYGSFPKGFAPGLTLHYPAGGGIASYGGWASKPLEARVDRKVKDILAMARNGRNGYLYIDLLGNIHQDIFLGDKCIQADSLNSKSIGVEISSPGIAFADKEGEYHAQYKFKTNSPKIAATKSMVGYHSIPETQLNFIEEDTQETKAGIYLKYYPAQVRAIFRLIWDMIYCDQGNGHFSLDNCHEKLFGHSMVTTKKDPGGCLYLTISELRAVIKAMCDELKAAGTSFTGLKSDKLFSIYYNTYVLKDRRYISFYKKFIDIDKQVPTWL